MNAFWKAMVVALVVTCWWQQSRVEVLERRLKAEIKARRDFDKAHVKAHGTEDESLWISLNDLSGVLD